jgi:hypothetical protein
MKPMLYNYRSQRRELYGLTALWLAILTTQGGSTLTTMTGIMIFNGGALFWGIQLLLVPFMTRLSAPFPLAWLLRLCLKPLRSILRGRL